MATWNGEVDSERDILTLKVRIQFLNFSNLNSIKDNNFKKYVETAQKMCLSLEKAGYWADYIDPSSGRPVNIFNF